MTKILILGAGGMAGHVISIYLRENGYEVDTLSSTHKVDENTHLLDVMNKALFEDFLNTHHYDIVINCIGILVAQSEDRKDLSTYLNAYLPHYLEHFYSESQTKVIHLSTDCVFSGMNAPYYENSTYDGELFYDRTKAIGEIINNKDLTFRMSIIGPDMQKNGIGLFNWFYTQSGEINGFTNAIWSGITTIELSKGIKSAIEQKLTGLYHLVPENNISKYDLMNLFKSTFKRDDIIIKPDNRDFVDKTLVNTRTDFNFSVLNYDDMLLEMKEWINNHSNLYEHYK
jgi:dTDP-4-dehydrorhamnose reductase